MIQQEVLELGCSECRRKCKTTIVAEGWCNIQVFQHEKLVVNSFDDLLQTGSRHLKVYASHAITVIEGKHDSSLIFGGEIVIIEIVVNDEWERGGMCEHFCHGRAR